MPTLLMVCGLEKSGATYIRQLLLDNLEIAPLDTHDNDHHNEPAMMLLREAAGISSDNMTAERPRLLNARNAKTRQRRAKTTLVVVVAKAPEAWVASSILRPHPHYKPMAGRSSVRGRHRHALLERRAKSHRDAFRLQRHL